MEQDQFEQIVRDSLRDLPEEIASRMSNVDVEVQDAPSGAQLASLGVPSGSTLLGLYQGVPLTRRTHGYNLVPPDRIIIFQEPLERTSRSEADLARRIRATVVHEVAHHFGISDERLREIESEREGPA